MNVTRHALPALVVAFLVAVCALPQAAVATTAGPQLGPLNPAFVEALHDPMVALGLGRMPSPVEVKVSAATQARAASVAYPTKYDLRAEGRLTPVKDQGIYSTCWAFGNIAALESAVLSEQAPGGAVPDYSEDNLIARAGFFSSRAQRYYWGGYDFMAVAYFARWAGPLPESADPYPPASVRTTPHAGHPVVKHVQGVAMIPGRTDPLDNDLIKQLVMKNGALSVGMWMDPDSYYDGTTNAYYDPYAEGENHGVDIVGWDDSYPASDFGATSGQPPGDGAFLARNTWGEGFGDGGYFWVSYYDRSFAMEQGLGGNGGMTSYSDVEGTGNYARRYQYDKLGVTEHVGYRSQRVWGANRFTAKATQSLSAVSFYTLASSTRYEVWAGRSFHTLRLRASGTQALPGYVTVPLTKRMRVYRRRQFVVAVKLVSPGEGYPLAIEYPRRIVAPAATASKGQSFISHNGRRWRDLTALYRRSNVCLKAFTR